MPRPCHRISLQVLSVCASQTTVTTRPPVAPPLPPSRTQTGPWGHSAATVPETAELGAATLPRLSVVAGSRTLPGRVHCAGPLPALLTSSLRRLSDDAATSLRRSVHPQSRRRVAADSAPSPRRVRADSILSSPQCVVVRLCDSSNRSWAYGGKFFLCAFGFKNLFPP